MRQVRRSRRHEAIIDMLTQQKHKDTDTTIFPTIRELQCFAAVLGYESSLRKPVDAKYSDLDGRLFSNNPQALDILNLIALSEKKDGSILKEENEDEVLTIFEEYAEGGFEVITRWIDETGDNYGDTAIFKGLEEFMHKIEIPPSEIDVQF